MGLFDKIRGMFASPGRGVAVLAAWLGVNESELRGVSVEYVEFTIPKRDGSPRRIAAPRPTLKAFQRRVFRRLLRKLPVHESVIGFERGLSFVDHARAHAGRPVIVHVDIRDFFGSTKEKRVSEYLRGIGWSRDAAALLCRVCCRDGGLPQGAPTSPRLANLVNGEMDRRLAGAAAAFGALYTRYADDLTFSFDKDVPTHIRTLLCMIDFILEENGYRPNRKKGPRVLRVHQRQIVTGLVINGGEPRLPRATRRWLRAVEHRSAGKSSSRKAPTLTQDQLKGWRALVQMIARAKKR